MVMSLNGESEHWCIVRLLLSAMAVWCLWRNPRARPFRVQVRRVESTVAHFPSSVALAAGTSTGEVWAIGALRTGCHCWRWIATLARSGAWRCPLTASGWPAAVRTGRCSCRRPAPGYCWRPCRATPVRSGVWELSADGRWCQRR